MNQDVLRQLPSVRKVLSAPDMTELAARVPRWALLEAARAAVEDRRAALQAGAPAKLPITAAELDGRCAALLAPRLRPVLNATGVVLHTNLGRAPLAEEAIARVASVARGYSNLEISLSTGERGSRHDLAGPLAAELCGAESAAVVNNNAAAILLTLSALVAGKTVLVSRGELVEIGGSFRVPDILALSGAHLREVGTTNRTHLRDYESALSPEVGAILKVHRSNFALVGFTTEPRREDLAALCRSRGILLLEDVGSGCLVEESFGGEREASAREVIAAGVDVVTISGDKLLGGPQAGIIAGRAPLLERIKKHPLARALRVDKLTLAALEATLQLYRDGASGRLPLLRMLRETRESLRGRAQNLATKLQEACPRALFACEDFCEKVGGGSLPLAELEGVAVSCVIQGVKASRLESALRRGDPPVLARIERERVFLHVRTLSPEDERKLVDRFAALSL